jgi:hypothetical protein
MSTPGQARSRPRRPLGGARLRQRLALLLVTLALLSGCRAYVPTPDARNLLVQGVAAGSLTVENRTPDLVCYAYITQDAATWGEDRLPPAEVIDPDSARHFEVGEGTWRVRLEDCSRRAVFQREDLVVGPEGTAIRLFARE